MPPSNSVGHGSVNDENSHADLPADDSGSTALIASGQVYQRDSIPEYNEQYEANKEALRQRRLELDRQIQALENENIDATSRSVGSLDRDGGLPSTYTKAERNNNRPPASSESHSTLPQPYRPPLAPPHSSGYPPPVPTTEESSGHSYQQRQQSPRHQLVVTANGGNVYGQHMNQQTVGQNRISSSASVGSVSTTSNHRSATDAFTNGSSLKTHGNASLPYPAHSNPYDPQFLAAAATAFHHQQQQAAFAAGNSGTTQQQNNNDVRGSNDNMLWKLLQDKEEELKEVRQTLRETQQKFQEQSLLATKLQTTLDQVQEAFEKERMLIKLQAEKEAQESLTSRQEEIFQKQLQWMENNIVNKNKKYNPLQHQPSQQKSASIDENDTFDTNVTTTTERGESGGNGTNQEAGLKSTTKGGASTTNGTKKTSEKKYPWKTGNKNSPGKDKASRNISSKNGENDEGKIESKSNDKEENKKFKIPSNSSSKKKLYPSIDETFMGNDAANNTYASGNVEVSQKSASLSSSANQNQNADNADGAIPRTSAAETPMANSMSTVKNSVNESMSSDRFDPVYVAQNANKEEGMAKEATYANIANDDDKSLGQTVASSTYGDDRVKVVNKKLLDPYGDKGTYTGVVLRNTGMPHGLGRMVYEEDRRVFEGDWRHGRWHGYGRASFSNGDSYEGEYKFDQRHGTGVYRWNDGRVYDGQFSEDKRHGKGIFTWPDGAVYDGDFVNGQRQGHGKYTFADGGQYEGSWKDGRYDGFGTCTWEDGRRYRGEWRNGMAHGRGTETYPNGNIRHEGEWIDDEPIR